MKDDQSDFLPDLLPYLETTSNISPSVCHFWVDVFPAKSRLVGYVFSFPGGYDVFPLFQVDQSGSKGFFPPMSGVAAAIDRYGLAEFPKLSAEELFKFSTGNMSSIHITITSQSLTWFTWKWGAPGIGDSFWKSSFLGFHVKLVFF